MIFLLRFISISINIVIIVILDTWELPSNMKIWLKCFCGLAVCLSLMHLLFSAWATICHVLSIKCTNVSYRNVNWNVNNYVTIIVY